MGISLNDTTLIFDGNTFGTTLFLSGTRSLLTTIPASTGNLFFSGAEKGCINFGTYILITSLHDYLQWGFQFLYPDGNGGQTGEWLPFAQSLPLGYSIGFNVFIDPSDVYNDAYDPCTLADCTFTDAYSSRRTYLNFSGKSFTGSNFTPTILTSNYINIFGAQASLKPVSEVPVSSPQDL